MESAAQVIGDAVVRADQAATLWVNSFHTPFTDSVWIFFSKVEADGRAAEMAPYGPGQQVLSPVLLHVIAPAFPIDNAVNARALSDFSRYGMPDVSVRGDRNVGNGDLFPFRRDDVSRIIRLSPRGGVKSGPVQDAEPFPPVLAAKSDRRVKLRQKAVAII